MKKLPIIYDTKAGNNTQIFHESPKKEVKLIESNDPPNKLNKPKVNFNYQS